MARAWAQLFEKSFSSDGTIYMTYSVTYVDPIQLVLEERQIPVTVLATDSAVVMQIKLSAAIKQGGADLGLVVTNDEITQPAYLKGITVYMPVRVAATGNVNIESPGATHDGVELTPGVDRILLTKQTNAAQNGIYNFVAADEPLVRSADADDEFEVTNGAAVAVVEGTANAQSQWLIVAIYPAPWVDGTSNTQWVSFVFPPLA